MKLTDKKIKALNPRDKQYKESDGRGMYLLVHPNGSKYWKLKYRINGKEKTLSIGLYPEVSLLEAREATNEAKKKIKEGTDPSQEKQLQKLLASSNCEDDFRSIAIDWHDNKKMQWTERHGTYVLRRIEADIFPILGNRPIREITAPELLAVIRLVEKRGAIDIAKRLLQTTGQIFRYGVSIGKVERDITQDLKGALKTRKKENYSYLKEDELPEFLTRLEAYDGEYQTKLGMKLLILTMVRTIELRGAKWSEINLDEKIWKIPSERMKMRKEHWIPLSNQAIEIFRELKNVTGSYEFVFPNRNKPKSFMSNNTLLYALYRLGYHSRATVHGFRATTSTILNEKGFNRDYIETQLAHSESNGSRASYNHAQYLEPRREMLQWWADYLDEKYIVTQTIKLSRS